MRNFRWIIYLYVPKSNLTDFCDDIDILILEKASINLVGCYGLENDHILFNLTHLCIDFLL